MKGPALVLCLILLAGGYSGLGCLKAAADDLPESKQEAKDKDGGVLTPAQLYQKVSPSVFEIVVQDDAGNLAGTGSCVVVGPHEVVTNKHVVAAGSKAFVKVKEEKLLPGELTYVCPNEDLVLLNVPQLTAPAQKVRSSKLLSVGEHVFAIGSPYALEESLSEGLISGLRPKGDSFYIQSTAQMLQGSSGGGLFDETGNLIGITSVIVSHAFGFALPAELIEPMHKHPLSQTEKLSDSKFRAKLCYDTALGYNMFSRTQQPNLSVKFMALEGEQVERATKLDPNNDTYFLQLGEICLKLGLASRAVSALEQAVQLNPKSAPNLFDLTSAYIAAKQPSKALATYDRILTVDSEIAKRVAEMLKASNVDINAPRVPNATPGQPNTSSTSGDGHGRNDQLAKEFVHYVVSAIKKNMPPYKATERRLVGLVFRIAADGTVSNIKIAASSGATEVDDLARIALASAAPFNWVPKELLGKENYIDLKVMVDYKPKDPGMPHE